LMRGVSEREFAATFGKTPSAVYKNEIAKLTGENLLLRQDGRLMLTPRGMDLANRVFSEFI